MAEHIIAKSYNGDLHAVFTCPTCGKDHKTEASLQELANGSVYFIEQMCHDRLLVIWLGFDRRALCPHEKCTNCKGTGKEVLFQVPEPCPKCKIATNISIQTLEAWYIQNIGAC